MKTAMNNYMGNQDIRICNIKLAQFQVPIVDSHRRYTPDSRNIRTRQLTKTPIFIKRTSSPEPPRTIHSTHEKRLSAFLQTQISQLSHGKEHMSPVARAKIDQLKSLMHMKSISMKFSQYVEPSCCHFTEYKLNHSEILNTESNLLHSRNTKNSPFGKSIKAKRLISKSEDSPRPSSKKNTDFKSIQVTKDSKYAPAKKIVLFGGSILRQARSKPKPESNYLLSRASRPISRQTHVGNLRDLRQNKKASQMETSQECKPWDTSIKTDHPLEL